MIRLKDMRWTLIALLLSVVGCETSAPFHGDVMFTEEERASIEKGAAFLSDHTTGDPLRIVWDAPHVEGACEEGTIHRGRLPGGPAGLTDPIHGCIMIGVENEDLNFLIPLAAHEFGHWRDLQHVGHGLMQPVGMALEWTDEDQAECVRVGAC